MQLTPFMNINRDLAQLTISHPNNKGLMTEIEGFASNLYVKLEALHQCQSFWQPDGNGNWEEELPNHLKALRKALNKYKNISHDVLYGAGLPEGTLLFCLMLARSHQTAEPHLAIEIGTGDETRIVHLDRVVHPRWAAFIWGTKDPRLPFVRKIKSGQRRISLQIQLDHLMHGHNIRNGLTKYAYAHTTLTLPTCHLPNAGCRLLTPNSGVWCKHKLPGSSDEDPLFPTPLWAAQLPDSIQSYHYALNSLVDFIQTRRSLAISSMDWSTLDRSTLNTSAVMPPQLFRQFQQLKPHLMIGDKDASRICLYNIYMPEAKRASFIKVQEPIHLSELAGHALQQAKEVALKFK